MSVIIQISILLRVILLYAIDQNAILPNVIVVNFVVPTDHHHIKTLTRCIEFSIFEPVEFLVSAIKLKVILMITLLAQCHYSNFYSGLSNSALCHKSKCNSAQCHYSECRCANCHDVKILTTTIEFSIFELVEFLLSDI